PKDAQERGYYVVPQELSIAKQLSVADNIFIGRDEFASKYGGVINKKYIYEESKRLLKEYFNIEVDPFMPAGELDTVTQRLIQVVRCLSAGAKIIVFDETTAGLSHTERDILFQHIKLLASKGIGIIFISHIISEMMEICDNITILRNGKLIGVEKMESLTSSRIIEMIAGKDLKVNISEKSPLSNEIVFSVRNLSSKNRSLSDISFEVRKGEIIGIYGLRDQGQTLLMETIFGAYKKGTGDIELEGKKINIKSPVDALKNGIVYLPNRGIKTVFPTKSIIENLIVQTSNFLDKSWFVKEKYEQQFTDDAVKTFRVRGYSSLNNKLSSLSGGNMQKVLIARAMMLNPKVLMFMEPTEGIDIGAKEEVKQLILQAAKQGKGIIIVTTEIDDIIEICHRAIIIRDRKLRAIIDSTEEKRNLIIEESTG
ncbi:MAG: ribose transport system ATP-binding protein, partial [Epulopiscium sp.]|nr:ribose transport system ATP-binding protein [Candidatus Epulonipiscium sp.]